MRKFNRKHFIIFISILGGLAIYFGILPIGLSYIPFVVEFADGNGYLGGLFFIVGGSGILALCGFIVYLILYPIIKGIIISIVDFVCPKENNDEKN